jgi:pilus assembly protein CpaE
MGGYEVLMGILSRRAAFVVLDIPHLWSPWVHDILVGANEVVITANSDLASLRTTKNLFDQLAPKRGVNAPIRVVVNNLGLSRNTELSPDEFEKAVSVRPSALIASNPALFGTSMNNGELIAQAGKKTAPSQQFDHLAAVLSGRMPVAVKPKRFSLIRGKTA